MRPKQQIVLDMIELQRTDIHLLILEAPTRGEVKAPVGLDYFTKLLKVMPNDTFTLDSYLAPRIEG